MTRHSNVQDMITRFYDSHDLPPGDDERFAGYGVMGVPFESGHYLAMRDFENTIGPPYRAVWLRDPDGTWTFIANTKPELSCARYFGAATDQPARYAEIETTWTGPRTLEVQVGDELTWTMEVRSTPVTALMSLLGAILPAAAWRSRWFLRVMGVMARPMLRIGRINLIGSVPSGQQYRAAPKRLWRIVDSRAVLNGVDLGGLDRPRPQGNLGDWYLPRRGLIAAGGSRFETFEAGRHQGPVSA